MVRLLVIMHQLFVEEQQMIARLLNFVFSILSQQFRVVKRISSVTGGAMRPAEPKLHVTCFQLFSIPQVDDRE